MSEFVNDLRRAMRTRRGHDINDAYADGFHEAAIISVGVISRRINDLLDQVGSGNYLSSQEQFLLSGLNDLKSETERELREFW